jgi:inosose dehydratase
MKVGCFALIDPFSCLEHQLQRIQEMGFKYADITDTHRGALLSSGYNFSATVSLDDNPGDVKQRFDKYGLTITSICAHSELLDPSAPFRFSTTDIMSAVRMANELGVQDVITTEGDAKTDWGHNLSDKERVFVIAEKLYEPLRLAECLGVRIMLEPHGIVTDTIDGIQAVFEKLKYPKNLGVNLDTGNSWLGGADPVEMAKTFKDVIWHIHWKDMPESSEEIRGTMYGCGMGDIALGTGVVDISGVYEALKDGDVDYTTIEIAGDDAILKSYEYLQNLGVE